MKIREYLKLSKEEQLALIEKNGKGLNWLEIQNSHDYLNHAIRHIRKVKYKDGLHRYSMKAAAEYLRWQSMAADGSRLFKVSNNLTADINHFLLRTFPELEGFMKANNRGGE